MRTCTQVRRAARPPPAFCLTLTTAQSARAKMAKAMGRFSGSMMGKAVHSCVLCLDEPLLA